MKSKQYSLLFGLLCGTAPLMAQEPAAPKLPEPPAAQQQAGAVNTVPAQPVQAAQTTQDKKKSKPAGEIELDIVAISQSFTPEAMPALAAKDIVKNGTQVKKGQALMTLNMDVLADAIIAAQMDLEGKQLEQEKAQFALEQGKVAGQRNIDNSTTALNRQTADHDAYLKTFLPQSIKENDINLSRAEENVLYKKENLRQLNRMYKEDQITEESEEIILTRTKNELDAAEKGLEAAKINHNWAKTVRIPRETEDRVRNLENAKIALENLKKQVSFELRAKELALKESEKKFQDATKKLAKLEADKSKININAAEDGTLVWIGQPTAVNLVYFLIPEDKTVSGKLVKLTDENTPLAVDNEAVAIIKNKDGKKIGWYPTKVKSVEGEKVSLSFEDFLKNIK